MYLVSVITKPPYEVNEAGWGEFEITIKIFFMDSSERPVRIWQQYSIHPIAYNAVHNLLKPTGKCLVWLYILQVIWTCNLMS